jgi:protoporphyrinogen oxidase
MSTSAPRIVIIGAGPTGLGAAWRLEELGQTDWILFEASRRVGGLAGSVIDKQGFTWDFGCHVLHSHYAYVNAIIERAIGDACIEHARDAWVWMRQRWIPYPLQNNLWRLPQDEALRCLDGVLEARLESSPAESATFEEWLCANFGCGLFETFLEPYNSKIWACPPSAMDVGWTRERVATVDVRSVVRNFVLQRDERSWGPNARFRFPLRGGTGAVWRNLYAQLPRHRTNLGCRVRSVDPIRRTIMLESGEESTYDALISTMPLDRLLSLLRDAPKLTSYRDRFVHSSCHIVGVGFEGSTPPELLTKSWIYFPEPELPFHRLTVFSNYSPHNVPHPGKQWSVIAEISESTRKPVNGRTVVHDVLAGLRHCGLIADNESVATRWHRRLEYGYPTPWLGRDMILDEVNRMLEAHNIFSRGRFGAWKYEVSNQDHSVMQGAEIVERLVHGAPEYTFHGEMRDSIYVGATTSLRSEDGSRMRDPYTHRKTACACVGDRQPVSGQPLSLKVERSNR